MHRFIPTCVGNCTLPQGLQHRCSVHPHVCGELIFTSAGVTSISGSSPRVWGTGNGIENSTLYKRFIPTCVGNCIDFNITNHDSAVHPHVCGELYSLLDVLYVLYGSSPRVWGTATMEFIDTKPDRFIPTCVGNCIKWYPRKRRVPVHPHVCGELCGGYCWFRPNYGSSPRVWGTVGFALWCMLLTRFIPTCVGNCSTHRYPVTSRSVHPHVCGELSSGLFGIFGRGGSSPRVWGTDRNIRLIIAPWRFIPTCVGN